MFLIALVVGSSILGAFPLPAVIHAETLSPAVADLVGYSSASAYGGAAGAGCWFPSGWPSPCSRAITHRPS